MPCQNLGSNSGNFKARVARKQKHVCCMTSLFEITFTHKAQNSKKACLKSSVNESNTIAF